MIEDSAGFSIGIFVVFDGQGYRAAYLAGTVDIEANLHCTPFARPCKTMLPCTTKQYHRKALTLATMAQKCLDKRL